MSQYPAHHGQWQNCITGEMAMAEWGFVLWRICGGRAIECFLHGSLGISWDLFIFLL